MAALSPRQAHWRTLQSTTVAPQPNRPLLTRLLVLAGIMEARIRNLKQLQRAHPDLDLGLDPGRDQVPKHFDIVLHRHGIQAISGSKRPLQRIAHMRVVKHPSNSRICYRKLDFGLLAQGVLPFLTFHGLHSLRPPADQSAKRRSTARRRYLRLIWVRPPFPAPANWARVIAGFAVVGVSMRNRKRSLAA
ncbi:MAG: hypothetical protein ACOYLS_09390 [Polymorphobacter sp.]